MSLSLSANGLVTISLDHDDKNRDRSLLIVTSLIMTQLGSIWDSVSFYLIEDDPVGVYLGVSFGVEHHGLVCPEVSLVHLLILGAHV